MKISALFLLTTLLLLSQQLFAQNTDFRYKKSNYSSDAGFISATKDTRYFSAGAGLSLFTYFGDASARDKIFKNALKVTRPGVSLFGQYHHSRWLAAKAEFFYGRIYGDDFNSDPNAGGSSSHNYVRNLSFRNDLFGFSLQAYLDILSDPYEYYQRREYNVYLMAGISMIYSNPKAKAPIDPNVLDTLGWVELRPLGTEGQTNPDFKKPYSRLQVGIPFGLGFRYKLSYRFDLYFEASLTYMLSDYIDDIGGNYVDLGALDSDLARAMSDRSQEQIAAPSGKERDQQFIQKVTDPYEYVSTYDGNTYQVFEGFGHEGPLRGGSTHDFIAVTSFRISYIIVK